MSPAITSDPTDTRKFAAPSNVSDLVFGPHNIFIRNGVTLNDRSKLEGYIVEEPTGFDTPARNVSSTQNVQQHGALPDTSFYGERTMTLTGWVQAGSLPEVLKLGKKLMNSCLSLDDKRMVISTLPGAFMQPDVEIFCKVADFNLDTKIQPGDMTGLFKRPFSISLKASDPVFLEVPVLSAVLVPTVVNQRGRIYNKVYPYQYNVPMDGQQNPVGTSGNTIVVQNAGNWLAQPKIKFTGPMGNTTLINQENGQSIYVKPLGAGKSVTIDTYSGDILDQDGYSAANMIETASDWMWFNGVYDEHTGSSTLALYTTSYDVGAKVEMTWRNTSI